MSESQRRFQRYTLSPGAFTSQRVRGTGLLGSIKGWKVCRVKDMSVAGALLLTKQDHYLGAGIEIELSTVEGQKLIFKGEVVNLGKDHQTNDNKLGVRIESPKAGSSEAKFVEGLEKRFKPSL